MPFIKTAVLGSPGAPVLPEVDAINHFNLVRANVFGAGTMHWQLYSQDELATELLTDLVMTTTGENLARSLSNFMKQKASLKIYTDAIDEVVKINRIVIYARPTFAEFPA